MLQSFQGALLFFQAAVDQLPDSPYVAKAREKLESAIDRAQQAITEGRDAVQGLRSSTIETNDLAAALSNLGKELTASEIDQNPPASDVHVEGEPKNLDPVLCDEVYRVAGEALHNSFRHAHASGSKWRFTMARSNFACEFAMTAKAWPQTLWQIKAALDITACAACTKGLN